LSTEVIFLRRPIASFAATRQTRSISPALYSQVSNADVAVRLRFPK
jgi:hypothetical protein